MWIHLVLLFARVHLSNVAGTTHSCKHRSCVREQLLYMNIRKSMAIVVILWNLHQPGYCAMCMFCICLELSIKLVFQFPIIMIIRFFFFPFPVRNISTARNVCAHTPRMIMECRKSNGLASCQAESTVCLVWCCDVNVMNMSLVLTPFDGVWFVQLQVKEFFKDPCIWCVWGYPTYKTNF